MSNTVTSLGVTYTENPSTPYIEHSSDQLDSNTPRLLALSTLGKPAYINNNNILYKNDINVSGSGNDPINLNYGTDSKLLEFGNTPSTGVTTEVKVKMPDEYHYDLSTEVNQAQSGASCVLKKVKKKDSEVNQNNSTILNIKPGSNDITVTADNNTNDITIGYNLPPANNSTLGGVIVGSGLSADGNGRLSCTINPNSYVKKSGDTMTGTLNFDSSGDFNSIKYNNVPAIGFRTGNSDGHMIIVGAKGTTMIGSGEGTEYILGNRPGTGANDELMVVASDENIEFYTNLQNGWSGRKVMIFDNVGNLSGMDSVYANAFFASSDAKLKTNITDVPKASISKIDKVKIHEFDWKDGGKHSVGVIAQDVKESGLDFLVKGDGTLSVDYTSILLLKIASLEEKIKELENKIK